MITIDLGTFQTKEALFTNLKHLLNLPTYFNNNLDSLYEVLSCYETPLTLEFINFEQFRQIFSNYANAFQNCLNQAQKDNSFLTITFK